MKKYEFAPRLLILLSLITLINFQIFAKKNKYSDLREDVYIGINVYDYSNKLIAASGDRPLLDSTTCCLFYNVKLGYGVGNRVSLKIPYIGLSGRNRERYIYLRNWMERTEENLGIDVCDSIRVGPDGTSVFFSFPNAKIYLYPPR